MIVNVLKNISTLKELNLNDNRNRSEELASAIASVVTNKYFLNSLSLSGNGLSNDGLMMIAQSLCNHFNVY